MLGAAASCLFILCTLVLFLLRLRTQSDALRAASAARLLLHQQLLADVLNIKIRTALTFYNNPAMMKSMLTSLIFTCSTSMRTLSPRR